MTCGRTRHLIRTNSCDYRPSDEHCKGSDYPPNIQLFLCRHYAKVRLPDMYTVQGTKAMLISGVINRLGLCPFILSALWSLNGAVVVISRG